MADITVDTVLRRIDETMEAVRFGLSDVDSSIPGRRNSGIRNVIMLGRTVTFVIQNLRTVSDRDEFDAWYQPLQDEMMADPLMQYFKKARNAIEKEGAMAELEHAGTVFGPQTIGPEQLGPLWERAPRGTTSISFGGPSGGAFYVVELADGTIEHVFFDIPDTFGSVTFLAHFADAPAGYEDQTVAQLCSTYVEKLSVLVDLAHQRYETK